MANWSHLMRHSWGQLKRCGLWLMNAVSLGWRTRSRILAPGVCQTAWHPYILPAIHVQFSDQAMRHFPLLLLVVQDKRRDVCFCLFPRCSVVKKLLQETQVQSLGLEDPLEEGMATHSSILAWKIPQREEPGGSQGVRHDLETKQQQ